MATARETTGALHTGAAMPATTTDTAPARRGGMFGGRKGARREEAAAVGGGRGDGFTIGAHARIGLLVSQILTAIAFMVVLGGLSSLQKRANSLSLLPQQQLLYNDVFQSGNQIPYPNNGRNQFGLAWWVLMFEIFIFTMIFVLLVFPRYLMRLKHTAMAFLVYVFVLTTLEIDSLLFFHRSPAANLLFGGSRIKATLAGVIFGAICNALSIIFLGLLRKDTLHTGGFGGKRVGVDQGGVSAV